jgi:hypothetical protein
MTRIVRRSKRLSTRRRPPISKLKNFPSEVLLTSFGFLSRNQLSSLQLTSRRFRNVVDVHSHQLAAIALQKLTLKCFADCAVIEALSWRSAEIKYINVQHSLTPFLCHFVVYDTFTLSFDRSRVRQGKKCAISKVGEKSVGKIVRDLNVIGRQNPNLWNRATCQLGFVPEKAVRPLLSCILSSPKFCFTEPLSSGKQRHVKELLNLCALRKCQHVDFYEYTFEEFGTAEIEWLHSDEHNHARTLTCWVRRFDHDETWQLFLKKFTVTTTVKLFNVEIYTEFPRKRLKKSAHNAVTNELLLMRQTADGTRIIRRGETAKTHL